MIPWEVAMQCLIGNFMSLPFLEVLHLSPPDKSLRPSTKERSSTSEYFVQVEVVVVSGEAVSRWSREDRRPHIDLLLPVVRSVPSGFSSYGPPRHHRWPTIRSNCPTDLH